MSATPHVCIDLIERAKGRAARLRVVIRVAEHLVFDSAWLALRIKSMAGASWLANAVVRAVESGRFVAPHGHAAESDRPQWRGTLDDFCATIEGKPAHVEHLSGPINGGVWFWSVAAIQDCSEYADLQPKNASAAKWLCELFARKA